MIDLAFCSMLEDELLEELKDKAFLLSSKPNTRIQVLAEGESFRICYRSGQGSWYFYPTERVLVHMYDLPSSYYEDNSTSNLKSVLSDAKSAILTKFVRDLDQILQQLSDEADLSLDNFHSIHFFLREFRVRPVENSSSRMGLFASINFAVAALPLHDSKTALT